MRTVHWDQPSQVRRIHDLKQDWERLYRSAILESDQTRLAQRIEVAQTAILERSHTLARSPADYGRERESINRALNILRLLRETNP